ncbi:25S rRNA (uridine(2843)-N(3))-methyltransferase [Paramyrothecium foliicola]|nr:25S rRNA (uridine(2843)-N(3))-methyltransferase [Paramyrothecium foliicola]
MARFDRKAKSQPKHGPASISGASKAAAVLPVNRPEWKGPGYIKKVPRKQPPPSQGKENNVKVLDQLVPQETQQALLDIFRDTFPESNDFDALKPALREIREAIDQQDLEKAFGTEDFLEKYTVRWSPSKALACSNIIAWLCREWEDQEWVRRFHDNDQQGPANVITFGRGAAEHMALVALLKHTHPSTAGHQSQDLSKETPEISENLESLTIQEPQPATQKTWLHVSQVDTANWSNVLTKLSHIYTTPRPLSQYASAKARASNNSFLSHEALAWNFTQRGVFDYGVEDVRSLIGPNPTLITLFFTLNELYSLSIPKTSAFLMKLTAAAPKGSLLLVVDSPGAFAESTIQNGEATEEREYPMHWLMHQALLPKKTQKVAKAEEEHAAWGKLAEEDNYSFQLSKGLRFPVSLENIKFQLHLLERL